MLIYADDMQSYKCSNQIHEGRVSVQAGSGISGGYGANFLGPGGEYGHDIALIGAKVEKTTKVVIGGWLKFSCLKWGGDSGDRWFGGIGSFGLKVGNSVNDLATITFTGSAWDREKLYPAIPELHFGLHEGTSAIQSQSDIPIDLSTGYHFFEALFDIGQAHMGNGVVKLCIDGVLMAEKNNLNWALDPTEDASKITEAVIYGETFAYSGEYPAGEVCITVDSFYVCNGDMGYHDDFLGPVKVSTLMPDRDGAQTNWLPYIDDQKMPETANFGALQNGMFDPESYNSYVEGGSHGERDLFYYMPSFDIRFIDLHGVIHAIAYKNTYTTNDLDLLKAIVPISKASGNDIVQEKPYVTQANEFTYNLLQVPYSIFPNLATPWTWELLENGQFGYEFRTKLWTCIVDEQMGISENLTIEVNP